jgi:hypothetical protein
MKEKGNSPSIWKKVNESSFASVLGKLLFLMLVSGLLVLLVLEKQGGGIEWIFARFPILKAVEVSPVGLYVIWLVSLWIGYRLGKRVGMKRGADKERKKLGLPF